MLPTNAPRPQRPRAEVEVTAASRRAIVDRPTDVLGRRIFAALQRGVDEIDADLTTGEIRVLANELRGVVLQLPYATRPATQRKSLPTYTLTPREKRILIGVALGYQVAEIGEQLCLSPHTVKTHLQSVYTQLSARNAAHAVTIAFRRGILTEADLTLPE
jgi:DNA-binding NarL/FixJ family response regulator